MGFANRVLLAVLSVSVAAYASDCGGMNTPEQAMRCCNSMRCSSHGHHHGQECCKAMPEMRAALGQPPSAHGFSFSLVTFAVVQAVNQAQTIESAARMIGEHSHAPPVARPQSVLSLRI